jgi:hypothetical protein
MTTMEFLVEAQRAYDVEQYSKALSLITDAESEGKGCPDLLLLKAACIQLASETDVPVDNALRIYDLLLDSCPNNALAWLEKAYFLLNVADNAQESLSNFAHSVKLISRSLESALLGSIKASIERGASKSEALHIAEACVSDILERIVKELDQN